MSRWSGKMWELYHEIWKERPHISELSGKKLGSTIKSYYFDHLLEKSKYPEVSFEKWNIILVTAKEHELKNNGFPLPEHKEWIEEAKDIYKLYIEINKTKH